MAPTFGTVSLNAALAILIPVGIVQGRCCVDLDTSRDPDGGAHLAVRGNDAQEHGDSLSVAPWQRIIG